MAICLQVWYCSVERVSDFLVLLIYITQVFPFLSSEKVYYHIQYTVETLYSTIYYSKYFIELNFDKSTQYVALLKFVLIVEMECLM